MSIGNKEKENIRQRLYYFMNREARFDYSPFYQNKILVTIDKH